MTIVLENPHTVSIVRTSAQLPTDPCPICSGTGRRKCDRKICHRCQGTRLTTRIAPLKPIVLRALNALHSAFPKDAGHCSLDVAYWTTEQINCVETQVWIGYALERLAAEGAIIRFEVEVPTIWEFDTDPRTRMEARYALACWPLAAQIALVAA